MYSSKSLLASLLAAAPAAFAATTVDDSQCDCFLSNGTKPTYFLNHKFIDFRSLSQYAGVPDLIDTIEGNAGASYTSDYFNEDSEFQQFLSIQNWSNEDPDFPMQHSKNNVYIQGNEDDVPASDTFLTMRTARHDGFQSAAEFETPEQYQYASMRMFARTIGSKGACTAMFTYRDAAELANVQEADIEVLTSEADDIIHYTNQPSYTDDGNDVEGASETVTLTDGLKWSKWATHRLDWTPDQTVWSVDGLQTAVNSFQVPVDPASLMWNAWSNGNTWTGKMDVGGVAYQQIQWIEVLYGPADAGSCQKVCSIDETAELGKPVLKGASEPRCLSSHKMRRSK
ncbi:concanavalin A-like lectin/glucanase domain-containing protein [Dactylonectria estremocensis]|uniref:Concanavalin A-like lectin/glucanase domain-containing protein n=1 Tax=Dactylonectria estremocensis TaxID=1079267 RepID=A0A9P9IN29_9HYPO|nr:concanavalin A-like lectin/glucanase domain-containing protein [Dactylonectria estremocensis]